jgi:ribonuclease VapC
MIVIDTSALVAIVFGEPEREDFVDIIQQAPRALIGIPAALETRMIVHGRLRLP